MPVPVALSIGLGVPLVMPVDEYVPLSRLPEASAALADPAASDSGQYSAGPSATIRCP